MVGKELMSRSGVNPTPLAGRQSRPRQVAGEDKELSLLREAIASRIRGER